ncbi:isoleucine--tRNA ligase [Croceibacterium mercuriale]|uniref:Isoleucine--tRNA ligase n=1 Tax=Croceibacterium mercuriale TaxID=1572751 RepID=A0A0B2BXQ6_9SPHN|nr:isoleucine--tRNA ligase [Croceibacterium mercuriale]KHL24625.1 isoleucine--tRNA ligase [Croceibacterium mercuriale]
MTEPRDYRDTVFLPKTAFPMKAGLPQKEPEILARWQAADLHGQLRAARAGAEKFILHDGPPYANGDMHIGHALNHVLKDMVIRTQTLLGKDAPYVPGWDCHGLPIEWKVEELYRKKKLNKDEVPADEFRAECRAYAANWVDVQREQLKRLGGMGDWDHPYLTMDYAAEATIVRELLKFAESGLLYRGAKPVMWSPVEKTALAEAEVEYEDITSTQIDVAFEIVESPVAELVGAHAVIWTTTPWTIPVNQALAYGPEVEYVLVEVSFTANGAQPFSDDAMNHRLLVADSLLPSFLARNTGTGVAETHRVVAHVTGSDLAGTKVRHPMHHLGGFFADLRPMLPGSFVTTDSGTGLVHMSPDHGEDDFELCREYGIGPKFVVEADGRYRADWPWLGGAASVINPKFNAPDGPVCTDLGDTGCLLSASADYKHSYPHSWRSKAKLIFRCTPQWFVPMDQAMAPFDYPVAGLDGIGGAVALGTAAQPQATLRQTAVQAIADTRWVPEKGRNRIGSMVEGRPDWVLSRQRAWGVPITLYVHRGTGEYLADPIVNAAIVDAVREGGVDAWYAGEFLTGEYDSDDYEKITDILDVWFDSGCTHAFVLESGRWPALQWPADLYLEGSDQHRGWFQSSLLESCATRGRAPYKAVLTHGFTMDGKGEKMSKSKGNTISPLDLMRDYGADIIRLWALSVDYTEDHRIGDEILKGVADGYRKLRNTLRYLLGALDGFDAGEALPVEQMPELERYMLARLGRLDATLREAVDAFDFNTYVRSVGEFCNEELSAFYFDIRKDSLYCDAPGDLRRRACRTVMDTLFHALIRYLAPVLVFTTEEAWGTRYPDADSVHLLEWPEVPVAEADEAHWAQLRSLREQVLEAIEPLRREKIVRSGLEAEVRVPAAAVPAGVSDALLAELFISGAVTRHDGDGVTVGKVDDAKCGRCWRLLPEVVEDGALCGRCADAVPQVETAA